MVGPVHGCIFNSLSCCDAPTFYLNRSLQRE